MVHGATLCSLWLLVCSCFWIARATPAPTPEPPTETSGDANYTGPCNIWSCTNEIRKEAKLACEEYVYFRPSTQDCLAWQDSASQACVNYCQNCSLIAEAMFQQCASMLFRLGLTDGDVIFDYCEETRTDFEATRCASAVIDKSTMCFTEEYDQCQVDCGNFANCDCKKNRAAFGQPDGCFGETILEGPIPGRPGLVHSCKLYPTTCKNHRIGPSHKCGYLRHCPTNLCIVENISCPIRDPCEKSGICNPGDGQCYYTFKPEGSFCSDGLFYTHSDVCVEGRCIGEIDYCLRDSPDCTTTNPCLQPSGNCDWRTGACIFEPRPRGTPCASKPGLNGDIGDIDGECLVGLCRRIEVDMCVKNNTNCSTYPEFGGCFLNETCDKDTGQCIRRWKPEGTPCDDNSSETTGDMCVDGLCVGFIPEKEYEELQESDCKEIEKSTRNRYYAYTNTPDDCRVQCSDDPTCMLYTYGYQVCTIHGAQTSTIGLQRLGHPDTNFWNKTWVLTDESWHVKYELTCFKKSLVGTVYPDPWGGLKEVLLLVTLFIIVVVPSLYVIYEARDWLARMFSCCCRCCGPKCRSCCSCFCRVCCNLDEELAEDLFSDEGLEFTPTYYATPVEAIKDDEDESSCFDWLSEITLPSLSDLVPRCCRRSQVSKVAMNPDDEKTDEEKAEPMLAGLIVVPWGVLGWVPGDENLLKKTKIDKKNWEMRAEEPDELTCVADIMELSALLLGPGPAIGGAALVYQWLEIQASVFPQEVKDAVRKETDAKHHAYNGPKNVIHAVAPELSGPQFAGGQPDEARNALTTMYRNIFSEFIDVPDALVLRMPPISGDAAVGEYSNELPTLTLDSMVAAYLTLEAERRSEWESRRPTIEFCTMLDREFDDFIHFVPEGIADTAKFNDLHPRIEKDTPDAEGGADDAADAKVDIVGCAEDGGSKKQHEQQRITAAERRTAARDAAAPYLDAAMQRLEEAKLAAEADAAAMPTSSEPGENFDGQTSLPRDPRGEVLAEEEDNAEKSAPPPPPPRAETPPREEDPAIVTAADEALEPLRDALRQAATADSDVYTGSDSILVIMRHSARLDDDFDDLSQIPEAEWPDKLQRPYDPPISDFELPVQSARGLAKYKIATIVSSPFRRCLQTAGLVARELGISEVFIDNRLGEHLPEAARCCQKAGLPAETNVEYLTVEQAQEVVFDNASDGVVTWDRSSNIPQEPDDLRFRVAEAIPAVAAAHAGVFGNNVLIVTHGGLMNFYLPEHPGIGEGVGKFKAEVAGWMAIRPPHGPRVEDENAILEMHRVVRPFDT